MRPLPKYQKPKPRPIMENENPSIFSAVEDIAEIQSILKRLSQFQKDYEKLYDDQNESYANLRDSTRKSIDDQMRKLQTEFKNSVKEVLLRIGKITSEIRNGEDRDDGKPNDPYSLTEKDKDEIAKKINPKVIKREVVREIRIVEKPIVKQITKNIIKEVAILNKELFLQLIKDLPDEVLEIKHIKILEQRLRQVESKSTLGSTGGGQGSWKQTALIGAIDGINRTYTFVGIEPAEFSERVFLNYIEQNPFTDYVITYASNQIVYTTAPDSSLSTSPHIIRYM